MMSEEVFIIPMSFAQQRLWFLDQLEPGNPIYNMPAALKLEGRVDVALLERCLNEVVERHEVLRTRFVAVDGEPRQLILPALKLTLPVIDLRGLAPAEREARARELSVEEARRGFDLGAGPLLRALMLRLEEERHLLLITLHHIVADGWSTGIFAREVAALYEAFAAGGPSPLPPLPVQYADYAVWQREWLTGGVLEEQLEYWKRLLAGAPATLELPADRPRPAAQSYRGGRVVEVFDAGLSGELKALSRREGVTLFMTLFAAFQTLLHRYTGATDIVTGTPIAGRTDAQTADLIGFFVNTLALRTDLSGDPPFRGLLGRVREAALGAYAHQAVPFERLVEELQVERSLGHSPLFQVMFVLNNAPQEEWHLPGLRLQPIEVDSGTAKFDITLSINETADGLVARLDYRADLFEEWSVRRLLGHYGRLLRAAAADPGARLSELELLGEGERRRLLVEWNETGAEYPRGECLHELFEAQAARTPHAPALVSDEGRLSYAELNRRADRLAHYLRHLGVRAESRVGVLMQRSAEMVTAVLAVLKAGGCYVPLDPQYPQERLSFMVADAGPRVILARGEAASRVYEGAKVLDVEALPAGEWPEGDLRGATGAENLAYVIYTSGSTGRPKGVMVSHRAICNHLRWRQQTYPLGESDRFLHKASLSFDISVWEMFAPLISGAQLILARPGGERDIPYLVRTVIERQVTVIHFGPAALRMFLQEPDAGDCASLRHVFCGGEVMSVELQQRFFARLGAELHSQYGPTEACVDATVWDCERETERASVPIGRPIANTQAYVLDAALRPVPPGARGELCLGGAGLARGYLNRAGQTAERFVPHPYAAEPGARLYRTGDVVRQLAGGELEYAGRADTQVKVRGFRIELGEIEAALGTHEAVEAAVAAVLGDEAADKSLAAYVVARQGAQVGREELREHLRRRLPEYMVPSSIVLLDALPLTPSGKVDRRALPAPGQDARQPDETFVAPRTPVEEMLADIWAQLLRVGRVGVHDNFFDLGGHSLLATQVIFRIREAFNVVVPLRGLFEQPTVAGLAQCVEAQMSRGLETPIPPLRPRAHASAELPLSYAQQRLWFIDQLQPDNAFYNIPTAVRLAGALNLRALEASLNEIIRRHGVLRATFGSRDGKPFQVIAPSLTLALNVTEPNAEDEEGRRAEAQRLLHEEARRPFDLARGPLVRALLVRLGEAEHLLLVTMHHIVSDGWSIGLFVREMSALYRAFLRGEPSPLPEPAVQYSDFTEWQRQRFEGGALEAEIAYWKQALKDAPLLLELPTDRPRPSVQTYRGSSRPLRLPASLSDELKALSQREGVTLFMTLLAAFYALLHRYTGQRDLIVGTPVAGRTHAGSENLIGLFLNMLTLRTDVSGDPPFRELLGRVREAALGAYAHQAVPFERLVEELQVERSLGHSPLFQVMLSLNNTPRERPTLEGLEVSFHKVGNDSAKFDLTFALADGPQGLFGEVSYSTDLFDPETIDRMVGHFEALLRAAAADPGARLSGLQLLGPQERHRLLTAWNDTATPFPHDSCVHELFEAQAGRTPDAPALFCEGEQLTYAELNRRANQLARYLRRAGVKAESRVAVLMDRSAQMVVSILGALKAGAGYVPLDPQYPRERLAFMVADAEPEVILTRESLAERARAGEQVRVLSLDRVWAEVEREGDEDLRETAGPENLAYVIYTSGSTGRPKGVMVCHRNVVNFFEAMGQRLGDEEAGTWLALTSISFDISVLEILWTLTRGFKVVLQKELEQVAAAAAAETPAPAAGKALDFSLFYFASEEHEDGRNRYELLLEGAKFADRHGFKAVWTPERHLHAFGGLYPNPSVTSAALATITERIQIRAGSVVVALHDPVRVAEEWSVVDNLSQGRVAISFASGWHANDFIFAPESYANRHEVMLRHINIVRRLWRGESVWRQGGGGGKVEVKLHPRPVQPELPFWMTSSGNPKTFQAAGEMGANLLTHLLGQRIEELEEKIALYRRAWLEHGHGPGDGHVTLMLHTFVGQEMEAVREKVRGPFTAYLRSSVDLLKNLARSLGQDMEARTFTEEDMEALLAHAFDRYFETSGLMGTPESCLRMVERLKRAGVDEVACLIDFGVDDASALAALSDLDEVRRRSEAAPAAREDYSIAAQLSRHRVTHLQCTPTMARLLTSDAEAAGALHGLRALLVGGEPLAPPLARQLLGLFPGRLYNMYGPTETTVWSTTQEVGRAQDARVTIGRPIANTRVYILDEHFNPAPVGVAGNLFIGGAGVVRGYLKRPGVTAQRFIPDPFGGEAGARLYDTGDRARYLPDGEIVFLGRADNQVKISGYRIEPGEIEHVLARHPEVREAAVVAREDGAGDKRLLAYVVADRGAAEVGGAGRPSPAEVERLLDGRPHFKLPNGLTVAQLSGFRTNVAYRELFEDDVYFRHGITLRDGDCVFDVGANIGLFTLLVNQRRKDLSVYAFEPIPATFDVLQTNVRLHAPRARVFNCGVSDRAGEAAFTFYPRMPGLSGRYSEEAQDKQITRSIIQQWLRTEGAEAGRAVLSPQELEQVLEEHFRSETHTCPLTTLSEVIREHGVERIDLLKIDVEKSEYDVLAGIRDEDWAKIKQIVIEVDTPELLRKITALLERHHYHFVVEDLVEVEGEGEREGVHVRMLYARRAGADEGARPEERAGPRAARPADGRPSNGSGPNGHGAGPSAGELRAYLRNELPEYMIPSAFVFLDALPQTPGGKLDLRALPDPEGARPALEVEYLAPRTGSEQKIAAIWQSVLGLESVGVHDNFFEVGGTSLLLIQVNSRLREVFGRPVPVVEMFRHPTISSLADHLDAEGEVKPSFERLHDRGRMQAESFGQRRPGAAERPLRGGRKRTPSGP